MSTFQPLIEAYHYHRLNSARTLTLTQGGAAAALTLTTTQTTTDALAAWAPLAKLLDFRAGRALAQAWHQTHMMTLRIKDTRARIEAHLDGPICRGGLIKVSPTSERGASYKLSQLDGTFVCSVTEVESLRTIGQAEELAEVVLRCQLSADIGG